jgi:alpha-amylase/alpha-mannosidase (GH57 family)
MNAEPSPSVIVHGHFYQPPRENPWMDAVELQPSAAPHHDWNARIAAECYTPNGWARLVDDREEIIRLVNNYAGISFDIGPTLLRWLERHTPSTYTRIVEGDAESRARFDGHGGAMAHPYVHAILPLTDGRDRSTLVKWGIEEFRFRFGRDPEGMWLPETAVDLPTLRQLVDHGIRFSILAPHQAVRVRPMHEERWLDVGVDGVDPSRPYRCLLPGGGSIDLFFYDTSLSRAIAFEGLLEHPERLLGRLAHVARQSGRSLFVLCTDGESYGHHTPFGERALATLTARGPSVGTVALSNFGAYRERHPPTYAVEIREGSSWSCAHGLERWRGDCGCTTGGEAGWRQEWRVHLRAAVEELREALRDVYVEHGSRYLSDVWGARDAYVRLLLDRSAPAVESYFKAHGRGPLSIEDQRAVLRLLEMQRHAFLMETSCGWFFADISGIETVQNLRHAARAIELASAFTSRDIVGPLLTRLHAAKSNLPAARDGRRIWDTEVSTARIGFGRAAALYAARALVEPPAEHCRIYAFDLRRLSVERRQLAHETGVEGGVEVRSSETLEHQEIAFALRWSDVEGLMGRLTPQRDKDSGEQPRRTIAMSGDGLRLPARSEPEPISWKTFSAEERREILTALYRARTDALHKGYDELAGTCRALLTAFLDEGLPPPESLRTPIAFLLPRDLEARLREWLASGGNDAYRAVVRMADAARRLGLDTPDRLETPLSEALIVRLRRLRASPSVEDARSVQDLLDMAERLGCATDQLDVLALVDDVMGHEVPPLIERALETGSRASYDLASALLRLGDRFGFSTRALRARIRPLEEQLAASPDLWP